MRILVVEDQPDLSRMIVEHLTDRGILADAVETTDEARAVLSVTTYDLLILDLGLAGGGGRELLQTTATNVDSLPTIAITARNSLEERLACLRDGADDCLSEPFSVEELEARLRAVLRRPRKRQPPHLECGTLSYDTVSRELMMGGTPIDVNKREAELLEVLLRASGRAVSRTFLEQRLYSFREPVTPNALEAVVSRLRRRLSIACANVRIETRRGIGYRLIAGADAAAPEMS